MLIFTKLNHKTKKAYFYFSASVFDHVGLYLTVYELCHRQNPFQFAFSLCPFRGTPTLLSVFIPLLYPVYPTLF